MNLQTTQDEIGNHRNIRLKGSESSTNFNRLDQQCLWFLVPTQSMSKNEPPINQRFCSFCTDTGILGDLEDVLELGREEHLPQEKSSQEGIF